MALLLAGAREALGDLFVGLYLGGSLASGDFDYANSDLDFLGATARAFPPEVEEDLAAFHARLGASGKRWAGELEGPYIPLAALRRHDPADCSFPTLRDDGTFGPDVYGSDWIIQRHVFRERGLVAAGPPPRELIDPVSPDELRRAALGTLLEWWRPKVEDPTILRHPGYPAYAVVTMCRILYTVRNGEVVSKRRAAEWGRQNLGEPWAGLVARGWVRPEEKSPIRVEEAQALIAHTIELAGAARLP